MWMAVILSCSSAYLSQMHGDESVEPSSTRIISSDTPFCFRTLSTQLAKYCSVLYTGIMTLTSIRF